MSITGDSGVESISGNGSYNYGVSANVTYKIKAGYHITTLTGTKADGDPNGNWTGLANKEGTVTDNWSMMCNRTIVVHTEPNTYTVTIHPNGGVLNVSDKSITQNSDGTASFTVTYGKEDYYNLGVTVTKTGYIMNGFYTAQNEGTKLWNNGGSCLQDGKYWNSSNQWIYTRNVDVYPQWISESYTWTVPANVTFDSASSSKSGSVSITNCRIGSGKNIVIKVDSDADFSMKDITNSSNKKKYFVKSGSTVLQAGDTVLSVASDNTGNTSVTYSFTDDGKYAGTYKDNLKFTASVE